MAVKRDILKLQSFLFVCLFVAFCFSRQTFSVAMELVLELALVD